MKRPPISGLIEIGLFVRKSAIADLRSSRRPPPLALRPAPSAWAGRGGASWHPIHPRPARSVADMNDLGLVTVDAVENLLDANIGCRRFRRCHRCGRDTVDSVGQRRQNVARAARAALV